MDNALDACEDAGILPEIWVEVSSEQEGLLRVSVEDNGPGIVEEQLGRIFGKLLYGSKFHKLRQSRGQQGMGIAAAGMYAQLTTGKPLYVQSRVQSEPTATELFVSINTAKNRPEIHKKKRVTWVRAHGTRVEAQIEGHYHRGSHSIGMYLKQTAIANPHVTIHFRGPHGDVWDHDRVTSELPAPGEHPTASARRRGRATDPDAQHHRESHPLAVSHERLLPRGTANGAGSSRRQAGT